MNVTGVGLKQDLFIASQKLQAAAVSDKSSFGQMLQAVQGNGQQAHDPRSSGEGKQDEKSALLDFLNTEDLSQLAGGKELLEQMAESPNSDWLTLVQSFLGVTGQEWPEPTADLENGNDSLPLSKDGVDLNSALLDVLATVSNGTFDDLNEKGILIIKAAKLLDLLSINSGGNEIASNLSPLLDTIKEKLLARSQTGKISLRSQHPSGLNRLEQDHQIAKTNVPEDHDLPLVMDALQNLMSFFQKNDRQQLNGGNDLVSQLQKEPQASMLQTIQNYLGISSNEKVSAVITQLGQLLNPKAVSGDELFSQLITGLAKLAPADQPNQWNLLEIAANTSQGFGQESKNNHEQANFVNLFSKRTGGLNKAVEVPITKTSKANFSVWDGQAFSFQPMSKPEQISIMLTGARKNTSGADMVRQFTAILAKSHFSQTDGVQRLLIKLSPEHLGSLRIELVQKDQTLVAKILTSTKTAKDILEAQLNGLKAAFAAQNIPVDRVEIGPQLSQLPQEQFLNRDHGQQGQGRRRQREETDPNGDEATDSFTLSLEDALFNTEA